MEAENYCHTCQGHKFYYACSICTATHLMRCNLCDKDKDLPSICAHCALLNRHGRRRAAKLRKQNRFTDI